ncbi:MAG: aspartate aminotransferase family protein [Rhodothermales bacterium]
MIENGAGEQDIEQFRSEGDLNISPRRDAWAKGYIEPETAALLAEDEKYFLHQSLSTPCLNVLTACDGPYITDQQGTRILDFHGNWVHQVGFSNPEVVRAITDQLQELSFCTRRYTNKPAIDLAKKLVSLAPGDLDKVLFAPGGTLAMGMALKLARTVTGRHKTISMWDAFHGASLDMISLGGEAIFRQNIGPLLPGTEHAPPPNPSECPWDCGKTCSLKCADYIEYMLKKEGDVAAVVAETVRSTPYIPPPEYWQKVRAACDRHGALLILDEIPHALGRTGKMFSVEHYGIVPDMLVIGKGLGGGIFPLAALIARGKFDVAGTRALGHYTHEKNPVACAAALATIKVIEEEGLLDHVAKLGAYARQRLEEMMAAHSFIGDVRGIGLMLGVEITHERANDLAEEIMYSALSKGLSFKLTMGNILLLVPALTITRVQMDEALDILARCFEEVE